MVIAPIASVHSTGIPNPTTITYATIGGPDATGGTDPSWAYDTSSSTMLQQVYEPLFMYDNMSNGKYIPLLADWWYGYNGTGTQSFTYSVNNTAPSMGSLVPINDNSAGIALVQSITGLTPPPWANNTWILHIRPGVYWQNNSYSTVQPSDVAYSIQRGILLNALTAVNWLLSTPMFGVGNAGAWFNQTGTYLGSSPTPSQVDALWDYNGTFQPTNTTNHLTTAAGVSGSYALGYAVKTCVEANDANGYVIFNLFAPYVPFMQILTQSWAMVTCEKWVIQNGGVNTTIALTDNPNNFTEFINHYSPTTSPLIAPSVIDRTYPTGFPMMGSGPYILADFNPDPHVGYQYYVLNPNYWGRKDPVIYNPNAAQNVHIIIIEEWSNRKFQFLSTGSTQVDLCDVMMSNAPELFPTYATTGFTSADVLTGLAQVNVSMLEADYMYFGYDALPAAGVNYEPSWGNGTMCATLFSDRYLREGIMYLFNESQYLAEAWLGTAIQPTSYICNGILQYNASVPVRACNIKEAVHDLQLAWGGQVWSKGITFDIVYNAGNTERAEACAELSAELDQIDSQYHVKIVCTVVAAPWADYMAVMFDHVAPVFIVGWLADYPDADDWAEPFMNPTTGTYAYASQLITYGLNYASLNQAWSTMNVNTTTDLYPAWGPMPFTDPLGKPVNDVTFNGSNGNANTYVTNLILAAPGQPDAVRVEIYNELMDIFYAEGGAYPLDQPIGKHFERDWIHGWIGGYSNNPVAVGDFFYQLSKAPPSVSTPIYGINLNAVSSITNVTYVPPKIPQGPIFVNYTVHVTYVNTTGPVIIVGLSLKRINILTGAYLVLTEKILTMGPGSSLTTSLIWSENTTGSNATWVIDFNAVPIATAGGEVYPTSSTTLDVNSTHTCTITSSVLGDLGGYPSGQVVPQFGYFDGSCGPDDIPLFIECYRGTAPAQWMYLGDLGGYPKGSVVPQLGYVDGKCGPDDIPLFIQCYRSGV
jgi:peptide/nickel transport system substrate-binding protein